MAHRDREDIRRINLRELVYKISEIENIEEIYIFGSRGYETGSLRSDIDILVYAPEGLRRDEVMPIMNEEKALDIFKSTNKTEAESFANDSRLRKNDIVAELDAKLLWSKKNGESSLLERYKEIKVLRDIDFKMSYMPTYSEAEIKFYKKYGHDAVFVIMPFRDELKQVYEIIKNKFTEKGLTAIRADEKEFKNDLWENVKVYLDCCNVAVAVFNKIDQDQDSPKYNPNVALEVGYILAKGGKICLLKDKKLPKLPTDLISKMYKEYDSDDVEGTLPESLELWIRDYLS
ncbi:MAG: nucleotidyltransferase domain-containing protein [Bacteroidales bacterium]|nr:nucleotidyltransferase domain-containing protein [Bacteroidales bacterium]